MSDKYESIRGFVAEALHLRERPGIAEYLRPSAYWKDFCKYSQYVRKLPEEELRFIRYHSWHLTGDNYQTYYCAPDTLKRSMVEEYCFLRARLKSDKPFAEGPDGIGIDTEFGRLTIDLLRYLLVMVELSEHGCLSMDQPQTVLEIGGGYGGLAAQCMTLNPSLAYVLLDLEETLFYQAVNLQNRFGADRVAFYDFATDRAPEPRPGRFHLIPQSKWAALQEMRFDVAINQQSMQEMCAQQVENYCDLLEKTTGRFYSSNLQHHSKRVRSQKGLVENLNEHLMRRFPVIWDSEAGRSWCSKALMHLPSSVTVMMLLTRDFAGRHSPTVSRLWKKLAGTPMRRFSEFRLQRLILAPGGSANPGPDKQT